MVPCYPPVYLRSVAGETEMKMDTEAGVIPPLLHRPRLLPQSDQLNAKTDADRSSDSDWALCLRGWFVRSQEAWRVLNRPKTCQGIEEVETGLVVSKLTWMENGRILLGITIARVHLAAPEKGWG